MDALALAGSKQKSPSLQDEFLEELQKNKTVVSVYLVNGIRLVGTMDGFDSFVVILASTTQQLIYKHAISTIVPGDTQRNVTHIKPEADGNYRRRDEPGMPRRNRSPQ
ncbi:MAG TPA: RNA chaperone Hfq [Burkholderiales bacterium]|nr:RNA chaperone Hfq [Burkholderiales bacterium]